MSIGIIKVFLIHFILGAQCSDCAQSAVGSLAQSPESAGCALASIIYVCAVHFISHASNMVWAYNKPGI